jgi:hypothetical protein
VNISNLSVASLFQQMQSMASGAFAGASFGAQMTGQNLPTIGASGSSSSSSLASSPLSATPSSQFASNILSALLAAQQAPPSAQTLAGQVISAINPGGNGSLSLGQVEQALTGSSATTSPQQLSIANAFGQLDANGDGSLSQTELATALQSLQQSDPLQGAGGHHHHHHHHMQAESAPDSTSATSSTASTASTSSDATTDDASTSTSPTPSTTPAATPAAA